MIFEIKRASIWNNEKPCDNSFPIDLVQVDKRRFRTPEEYKRRCGEEWTAKGANHRVHDDGWIIRDTGNRTVWGIEINSLDELLNLGDVLKSDLVLGTSYVDQKTPSILIYDDYIE